MIIRVEGGMVTWLGLVVAPRRPRRTLEIT
jgi:hypothetical protein